uniref:Uncharacterized protein n=1 Tax=Anguilla anguilla TaxID=7936 RepID=A0A0E9W3K2_ANGAN
MALHKLVKAPF